MASKYYFSTVSVSATEGGCRTEIVEAKDGPSLLRGTIDKVDQEWQEARVNVIIYASLYVIESGETVELMRFHRGSD